MGTPAKGNRSAATASLFGSIALHLLVLGGVGVVAYRSLAAREAREAERQRVAPPAAAMSFELPPFSEGSLLSERDVVPEGEVPTALGGSQIARVDTGTPGTGGEAKGAPATNLAAMAEQSKLDTDPLSRLDRDQVQRLKTASHRTTHDDRRATTHPMELTFLATGREGGRDERRPFSELDPSRGALRSSAAAVLGGAPGSSDPADVGEGSAPGASKAGQLLGSPGVGVRGGEAGDEHRLAARVSYARPAVAEAKPTVPGIWNGRPNDTVDSDQEVASAIQHIVHASVAGGIGQEGRGGSPSPKPDPGAGGGSVARGSVARALGSGDGDLVDWNTSDPALVPYFRKIHAKVDPLWANAFPKSAMAELKQGTVILELTIAADGTAKVAWPPLRPSGIDEFDRNCADALRRASPFDPLPAAFRDQGRTSLRIRAPFIAKNPIVR